MSPSSRKKLRKSSFDQQRCHLANFPMTELQYRRDEKSRATCHWYEYISLNRCHEESRAKNADIWPFGFTDFTVTLRATCEYGML